MRNSRIHDEPERVFNPGDRPHSGSVQDDRQYHGLHAGVPAAAPPSDGFDMLKIMRIMLRRWLILVMMGIVGGLSAYLLYMYTIPIYKARADLEMRVRRPKVTNSDAIFDEGGGARDDDAIFNTRFAKFRSPAMERLATAEYFKRYTADESAGIIKNLLPMHIREVNWSKDSKADIVRVVYVHPNPEFAARLVNVLSYCAGVLMMQENQALSDEAVKWLISQVEEQRDSLETVENMLADIREELQLDSLEQRKAVLAQALLSVSAERETVISTLSSRRTVFNFVTGLKDSENNLEVLPTGLPKEEQLNELIRVWREADEEFLRTSSKYTDVHPNYRSAKDKEKRAYQRLQQFIDMASQSVQNELELLESQLGQLDVRINSMKKEALGLELDIVAGHQRLQRLERKRDAADDAYQSVLRRMEEARMSADENMAYTKIIRNAEIPELPVSPNRIRMLIVGIFLGGMFGGVIALIMDFFLDRITAVNDLKGLGINVLCTIPTQKKVDSRAELATIALRDKFSPMVEVFAGLNALITSERYRRYSRLLLLTSLAPGEGKTIATCNLAISSSVNGIRTLLIDGDLRRPQLGNVFGVDEGHPSLLEWLSDEENMMAHEELIVKNVIGDLDIITSRPLRGVTPAELLGRSRMEELLVWARKHYDRVIIDSPPLGPVGDAQLLANHADAVVLVSRIGVTRRRGLRYAISRFNDAQVPILGCIANDVPHSLAGMFGGGEGYGYGRYGSYGEN